MPPFYAPRQHRMEIIERLDLVAAALEKFTDLDDKWSSPPARDFGTALALVRRLRDRYDEPFRLAVVGEFNAGKSALINALLGRPGTVPEGVVPTTGAVTELWRGEDTGRVLAADGTEIYSGTLDGARAYGDQRTAEGRRISGVGARIVLHVDSDLLDNLVIIDTPGLGANDPDDRVTLEALSLADAGLLVLNGHQPGGEDSLLLSERLRVADRRLVTVVTRIDQLSADDREKVFEAVRQEFGAVASGEPIGVDSPEICRALQAQADAESRRDGTALDAARDRLDAAGYTELRARLAETFLLGDASTHRASGTLAELRGVLNELRLATTDEAIRSRQRAEDLASEVSELDRRLDEVLRRKKIVLRAKVDEVVDEQVGILMAGLSDAADLFIEGLADGNHLLGLRSLAGKVSNRQREKVEAQLKASFDDLFPASNFEMTVQRIERRLRPIMELEWMEAVGPFDADVPEAFDPARITTRLIEQIGSATVAGLAQLTGAILLLFVPGAALIDAALLVGASGVHSLKGRRLPAKVVRIQRMTRTRLRSVREQLSLELGTTFDDINEKVAEQMAAPVRADRSAAETNHLEVLDLARRWLDVTDQLGRLAREDNDGARAGGG